MSLARTQSIALVGVEGHPVEIEADIENGLVGLLLVGLPDTALREARDRIRSAIVNSSETWPNRRITVGLSPASLPKRGSSFDLGIAVAILSAAGGIPPAAIAEMMFLGELGLDGRLRPVRGVLPAVAAAAAARRGMPKVGAFAPVVLPPGGAKALVQKTCGTSCHSVEVVTSQRMNETEWNAMVQSMVARGAPASDAEAKIIAEYLAKTLGR